MKGFHHYESMPLTCWSYFRCSPFESECSLCVFFSYFSIWCSPFVFSTWLKQVPNSHPCDGARGSPFPCHAMASARDPRDQGNTNNANRIVYGFFTLAAMDPCFLWANHSCKEWKPITFMSRETRHFSLVKQDYDYHTPSRYCIQ